MKRFLTILTVFAISLPSYAQFLWPIKGTDAGSNIISRPQHYVDNELNAKQKGFFAIYHSNCENSVPLIFERNFSDKDNSFDGKHFVAGNNDRVDIEDIIMNKDLVNSYMNETLSSRLENKNNEMSK